MVKITKEEAQNFIEATENEGIEYTVLHNNPLRDTKDKYLQELFEKYKEAQNELMGYIYDIGEIDE